jgi:hypothetical protein
MIITITTNTGLNAITNMDLNVSMTIITTTNMLRPTTHTTTTATAAFSGVR